MSNFNQEAVKRGAAAIKETNEQRESSNGEWKPFFRTIYWNSDEESGGNEHYLLFLTPLESLKLSDEYVVQGVPEVLWHGFLPQEGSKFPAQVIARTWEPIGEPVDPIQEKWLYGPRKTDLLIAVELEPTFEEDEDGIKRPIGMAVKLQNFERRIRDEDGELTEEREACVVPIIGLVAQSPFNFGNQLAAFDHKNGRIHKTPLCITRTGSGTNTTFMVEGFRNLKVDLAPLVENIDLLAYLQDSDALEEILGLIEGKSEQDAALIIGDRLLDKVLDEKTDREVYDEIFKLINQPSKYAKEKSTGKAQPRRARPSQRVDLATFKGVLDNAPLEDEDIPFEEAAKPLSKEERKESLKARLAGKAA